MSPQKRKSKKDVKVQGPAEVSQTEQDIPEEAVAADASVGKAPAESSTAEGPGAGASDQDGLQALQDEVAALQTQLAESEARATQYLEGLQRERAEFQNYKKRIERERVEQQQNIVGSVLLKLLPALDDFHRAMDVVPEDQQDEWFNGVALIQRKLENLLKDYGVTEIDALGKPFDPALHEAIGQDDAPDVESETVTMVLQRGYKINDRLLRPAYVRVAR